MDLLVRMIRKVKALQWLCGKITGHSPSLTDWGYGSGPMADTWCRYCDKMFQIPLHELKRIHPHMPALVEGITGKPPQHIKALSKPGKEIEK